MAGSASGQDKQILCSDWLLKRVTCMGPTPCSHGFRTLVPQEKVLGEIKKKNLHQIANKNRKRARNIARIS